MFDSIVLGVLQGLFEWVPISSEGIVALAGQFLTQEFNPIDMALFLHLGTLFAVLIYFRKDWQKVMVFKNPELLRFLIISTIISLAIGYPLYKLVRDIAVGNTFLIIMGFGLLFTAYFQKTKRKFEISQDKLALIAGFLQGLAVIPGLSRSGSTIFGLSLGKADPSQILKISYMMSAPVVIASSAYLFLENPVLIFEGLPSLLASFLVGFFSLRLLMNIIKKINFYQFALIFSLRCFLVAIIGFVS